MAYSKVLNYIHIKRALKDCNRLQFLFSLITLRFQNVPFSDPKLFKNLGNIYRPMLKEAVSSLILGNTSRVLNLFTLAIVKTFKKFHRK